MREAIQIWGEGLRRRGIERKRLASGLKPGKARCVCVTNGAPEETTRGCGGGEMGGASGQHLARLGWGRGERGGAEDGRGCC